MTSPTTKIVPENYVLENGKLMFDAHAALQNKKKHKQDKKPKEKK